MPHHVYAAKTKVLSGRKERRAVGEVSADSAIAPYRFALRSQRCFKLNERQTIHYIGFGQPPFARYPYSKPQILQSLRAMGVRINHTFNPFLLR